MATRFYLSLSVSPPVSPAFDANWEQTGQATRGVLRRKSMLSVLEALTDSAAITVPITTTQDILNRQFVSDLIPPQLISGTVSIVVRGLESATTANVHNAYSLRVINDDGTVRGTLASFFSTATEYTASAQTRIINAVAVTALATLPGDRLVLEYGGHAAAPTAGTTYTQRFGDNAASDFALTSGLTTDLNPWIELSQDIWAAMPNNYQFVGAGSSGMSVSEKIR